MSGGYAIIIVIWLILCVVVGYVAESIGRSFVSYVWLSIFLSPLIGFIILAIKGRATKEEASVNTATSSGRESGADEIRKFKELLDDGIITQEEFDAKKKQLLES